MPHLVHSFCQRITVRHNDQFYMHVGGSACFISETTFHIANSNSVRSHITLKELKFGTFLQKQLNVQNMSLWELDGADSGLILICRFATSFANNLVN
jgi:hypothetical protein